LFLSYAAVIIAAFFLFLKFRSQFSEEYIFATGIGLLTAHILYFLTKQFFIKPLHKMQKTTRKLVKGDFSSSIPLLPRDVFGDLADNLNELSSELKSKITEITHDKNELKAILSSMVEGVIVIGKDEKILILTSPIYRMLDLRSRDVSNKPYWEIIRNEEINSLIRETFIHKKAIKKQLTIISPDETHFNTQISPVLNEEGNLKGVVVLFHDITELKKLETLRSEFVANVSHELKTPLTSIKGFVETLREGALSDKKKAEQFLGIIQTHTQRLEDLVNDLLSLSLLESKELKLNLVPLKIQELIDPILGLYRERFDEKNQVIFNAIQGNIPRVLADRKKMEQVFSNLLDNAIKYTPEGGKVSLDAKEEDGFIRVDIKDSGVGISEEHLPQIFERFYRVDKDRARDSGGTGLGLAIIKHILQAHDGKVTVQSEPQKGSIFSVFLPKA